MYKLAGINNNDALKTTATFALFNKMAPGIWSGNGYGGDWYFYGLGQTDAVHGWFYSMQHFDQYTGGYYITLAPDTLDDKDVFDNVKDAINSFMPAVRVFVAQNGEVNIVKVRRLNDGDVCQPGTTWPPSAGALTNRLFPDNDLSSGLDRWQDSTVVGGNAPFGVLCASQPGASSTWRWDNFGYTWKRRTFMDPENAKGTSADARVFVGPITDAISESMIKNKQWWSNGLSN
jgi:hypothetical protein